jgi:hypothetical protein
MIRRYALQKKLAIAAMVGMMMLLAVSCGGQTPLMNSGQEDCTSCIANKSILQGLGDAGLSGSSMGPTLGAPEPVSPLGTQNSGKLTYTWRGMGGVQNYCLVVKDKLNRVVIKQCCNALPAKTTYSITPRQTLASGDYSWSVSYKIRGRTLWSDQMDFTVCASLPGKATLVSPKDTIGSKNPIFTWNPLDGGIRYRLTVAKAGSPDTPIFDRIYDVEDVLSNIDHTCSVGPVLPQDLEEAVYYRWWIQTINCMGEGPKSYFKDFMYKTVIPGKPNTISPSGLISTDSPNFVWTAASAATKYHLEVYIRNKSPADDFILVDEGWFDANKVTKGYRCMGSLGPLPDDDSVYLWRVQASNDGGINGQWSSWRYFETVCAFKPGKNAKKARMG